MQAVAEQSEITIDGLCTQLASADTEPPTSAHRQLDAFERECARFRAAGHEPSMIHAANSAATFRLPRSHFTHVRAGIALFGGDEPSGAVLRAAMRVTTHIVQLRSVAAGESVSYGETWTAARAAQIATLPGRVRARLPAVVCVGKPRSSSAGAAAQSSAQSAWR